MQYTAERLKFQFHNGTIKTLIKFRNKTGEESFNSITVQLRPDEEMKRVSNSPVSIP